MFKKLFKKTPSEEAIVAPISGKVVKLEEVPDPTFSEKMMGEGLAIEPTSGKVVSPVKGKIVQVFPTKHAVGIETEQGTELLIHIGLETVGMEGDGFEGHVEVNDKVGIGDPLVSFDLEKVQEKAASTVSPIVVTNGQADDRIEHTEETDVEAGETPVFTYYPS
ncbi:PTS system glucose-specific IIA component [Geomicrobium halophilum]|uniref:PTS system glucose-specific IIA component n=1 Tax=Geomicrobium halophilum TaxID=549000 RepID=A0A841PYZ8_9BACL|nr:PTS glucose transporter subunit IIA [Geomicrobium halophilum]MBB6450013.1 PTS system glucose-specific IIA component [Geomicrobium halophilum]